ETEIAIALNLDSLPADPAMSEITTGVPFLDHMLDAFARHGHFTLAVRATGDTRIDDHHTVEDVGLVLGQTFLAALGERVGVARGNAGGLAGRSCAFDERDARMIVVVDYGAANLLSITRALEAVGASVVISGKPGAIAAAEGIVLPGVGAAGSAMEMLRAS